MCLTNIFAQWSRRCIETALIITYSTLADGCMLPIKRFRRVSAKLPSSCSIHSGLFRDSSVGRRAQTQLIPAERRQLCNCFDARPMSRSFPGLRFSRPSLSTAQPILRRRPAATFPRVYTERT
jgi:hypothetical protein